MGVVTNRMLTRAIIVDNVGDTTLIGVGREGVMDGGDKMTVGFDGETGSTTGDLTVTIYQRATPGGPLLPNATTVPITHDSKDSIELTGVNAYEIVMVCTTTAVADETWWIDCTVQRG